MTFVIKLFLISMLLFKAAATLALSEAQYQEKIQTILTPFVKEHMTEGSFQT